MLLPYHLMHLVYFSQIELVIEQDIGIVILVVKWLSSDKLWR